MLERLYDVFDSDGNGVVDFSELASGLSVLCGGERDAKAEAAFALYDYNGDGFISLEEMTRYLASVFRVLFESVPGTAERSKPRRPKPTRAHHPFRKPTRCRVASDSKHRSEGRRALISVRGPSP